MAFVYSCCFWFSLRLGGILIGILSLLQALMVLILCCLAYNHSEEVKNEISILVNNINLIYMKHYIEYVKSDPEKYITFIISFTCVYILICLMYIYGAYKCNNALMAVYILVELLRIIVLFVTIATCLLVLKQNTMDIGLLIGASVAGGFLLLGKFYLWVCAANLPILINEIEQDEQAEVIAKLQQLLKTSDTKTFKRDLDEIPLTGGNEKIFRRGVFLVSEAQRQRWY